MPLHHPAPVRHTIAVQNRLRANRCRIEQKLCAVQRQAASCLGEPLVPADADTNAALFCIKHGKTAVTRLEVKLLLIKMVVRNMRFAINAKNFPVCINAGDGII